MRGTAATFLGRPDGATGDVRFIFRARWNASRL